MRAHRARRMPTDDRAVLEEIIFREVYVGARYSRILFVGCSEFTSWYPVLFENTAIVFETVDVDPDRERFGAPNHHFVADFESLANRAALRGEYDLIFLNGVLGYGIDSPPQKTAALRTAHALLKPGGRLLVGFRDPPVDPDLDLSDVEPALFAPVDIPGLSSWRHRTSDANLHTFVCYEKQERAQMCTRLL
jgi:SAM-dependent methyltransferase